VSPSPRRPNQNGSSAGLTIVRKGGARTWKRPSKIALVLAGGAITGGGFKLGALRALDDLLVDRKTTDFDIYVGLSAGAFLAAPLAAGVTPEAMLRTLDGTGDEFTRVGLREIYNPNVREFAGKPVDFLVDLITSLPKWAADLAERSPKLLERLGKGLTGLVGARSWESVYDVLAPMWDDLPCAPKVPFVLDYLPAGLFDNSSIERYLRDNLERNGIPNEFRALHRRCGSELYIVAMNLDTSERVVFGHDEDVSLTISEAVQASTALPGFYKPARLHDVDYVDGGVRRTANIDVAIEHGADLIICYNPFRPFSNHLADRQVSEADGVGSDGPMADRGILTVMNQVFRTLLHSRLQLGLQRYEQDPDFHGDIILIEPTENDHAFFQMAPVDPRKCRQAVEHGYVSVRDSIESHYDVVSEILESHGIGMTGGRLPRVA
jgi:predicted acylesterase/phospholipase RssA